MPLLVSFIIHCLALSPLAFQSSGKGKGSAGDMLATSQASPATRPSSAPNLPYAPKEPMLVELIPEPKREAPALKPKRKRMVAKKNTRKCTTYYEGVGLTFDWRGHSGAVTELAPDGPAERAGVYVGDILLNQQNELLGPAGSVTYIQVLRAGQVHTFEVTRDRICQDGR
jgi:S1-C subfamily serine protease